MLAPLRRIARFVRIVLVCLALVWSSAPTATAPITDIVALVAVSREVAAERVLAEPSDRSAHEPAARLSGGEPFTGRVRASRAPSQPRRLYLEHRALLC